MRVNMIFDFLRLKYRGYSKNSTRCSFPSECKRALGSHTIPYLAMPKKIVHQNEKREREKKKKQHTSQLRPTSIHSGLIVHLTDQ